jgi:hypothetical protein
LLKLDRTRLDALFTGKAVTIRKDADSDTAARFQVAFKRAGARLRVVPAALTEAPPETPAEKKPAVAPATAKTEAGTDAAGFKLAPVGATLVAPKTTAAPAAPELSHLTLAAPGAVLGTPRAVTAQAPDTSHLTVAALGADIGEPALPAVAAEAPTWEIAQAGVVLIPPSPDVEPAIDLDAIDFELTPPGTLLVDADETPPPAPPDTSHLRIQ